MNLKQVFSTSLTSIVIGAAFLAPALAQPPQPRGQLPVVITADDDKQVSKPAQTSSAPAHSERPGKVGDPFVQPLLSVSETNFPPAVQPPPSPGGNPVVPGTPVPQVVSPGPPPPAVTITGIVASGSGNRAILTSPSRSYLVRAGDRLGDYRVAAIDPRSVTFELQQKSFKVKINQDLAFKPSPSGKAR